MLFLVTILIYQSPDPLGPFPSLTGSEDSTSWATLQLLCFSYFCINIKISCYKWALDSTSMCSVSPIWEVSEQLISITSPVMIYTHVFILIRPRIKKLWVFFVQNSLSLLIIAINRQYHCRLLNGSDCLLCGSEVFVRNRYLLYEVFLEAICFFLWKRQFC